MMMIIVVRNLLFFFNNIAVSKCCNILIYKTNEPCKKPYLANRINLFFMLNMYYYNIDRVTQGATRSILFFLLYFN